MINNNCLGVKEIRQKCKSFFEQYSNRLQQQISKQRDSQQYQSLCQQEVRKFEKIYIKPKRSVQYNSIQTESNQIDNYISCQRRQSTEPKANSKRRNHIIKTKILSQQDLHKSCEIDTFNNQEIPIGDVTIQYHQNSENHKTSIINNNKENQKENNLRLPILKKQFDKSDNKNNQTKISKFGESFVTPFFGTKKPISLDKRPCEFQGLVYKRKK
ncbi:unnamed protein product [Paramecium pentaurelia]|uniref:Uncharacterized protein n=1 Tax=Paramecium pentaurelia TaxID=43138 RepID=A0A8S1XT22_9CILI|nr:unnamed protein product [Paramecium pentaurelia]